MALRKLLEAKDAAVRVALFVDDPHAVPTRPAEAAYLAESLKK